MDYREEIESFLPLCEQEKTDREVMLECCRLFGDRILERSCRLAHLTASSMIFNRERTKVLLAYHNIYDSWAWTGGHSDGERDGLKTAVKEAMEETGIYWKPLNFKLEADVFDVQLVNASEVKNIS